MLFLMKPNSWEMTFPRREGYKKEQAVSPSLSPGIHSYSPQICEKEGPAQCLEEVVLSTCTPLASKMRLCSHQVQVGHAVFRGTIVIWIPPLSYLASFTWSSTQFHLSNSPSILRLQIHPGRHPELVWVDPSWVRFMCTLAKGDHCILRINF